MIAVLTLASEEARRRWPSRAAPIENFAQRGLRIEGGRWFCTIEGCPKATDPFPNPASAKSHPYAAHKIRSSFSGSRKRRERRYRSAPIASEQMMQYVDTFLAGLRIQEFSRHRLRREILTVVGVPSDAAPPPPTLVPALAHLSSAVKWRQGELFPGEVEELRRQALNMVHAYALQSKRTPAAIVDALGKIVDRRFYRIGATGIDASDAYGGSTKASIQLERLGELFSHGARR